MAEMHPFYGGIFYPVLRRVGLADDTGLRVGRAISVLPGLCWIPLLVLTVVSGTAWGRAVSIPFLQDLTAYGRFLIALPLLLLGEKVVNEVVGRVHEYARDTALVADDEEVTAEAARTRLGKRGASPAVEVALLAVALALPWLGLMVTRGHQADSQVTSWLFQPDDALSPAGWWYLTVAVPFVLFVILRWIWGYLSWSWFLWSFAKLRLQLQATHPDEMGGLAPLTVAQTTFSTLFLGGSVLLAAFMANDIMYADATLRGLAPEILSYVALATVLLLAPLLVFFPGLRRAKIDGLLKYGRLGDTMTDTFDHRWAGSGPSKDPNGLIDTADPSSVTDFSAMYDVVAGMQSFPFNLRQAAAMVVLLLIPFAPLLLTAMSLKQLLQRLLGMVV